MSTRFENLGIKKIRYIVMCAQEQSFTEAAVKSCISQPALAIVIREVEDIVGFKIFERLNKARTTKLTRNGTELLSVFRNIINNYDYEFNKFAEFSSNKNIKKRIIIQDCFSAGVSHDWIFHIIKHLNNANVELETGRRGDIIEDVKQRKAAVGLVDNSDHIENVDAIRVGSVEMNMALFLPEGVVLKPDAADGVLWNNLPDNTIISDFEGTSLRRYVREQLKLCDKNIGQFNSIKAQTFLMQAVRLQTNPVLMPLSEALRFSETLNFRYFNMAGPGVKVELMLVMPWGHMRTINVSRLKDFSSVVAA